ncbi:isochorismatase family protein, partial [Streptomyces sp. NPDC127574]
MAVTTIDPRTALVVIDLQHGIVGNPGVAPHPAADVVERSARLADAFRGHGLPVVLVRVTAAADGSDAVSGRTDGASRGRSFPEGWDVIVDDLAGHPED